MIIVRQIYLKTLEIHEQELNQCKKEIYQVLIESSFSTLTCFYWLSDISWRLKLYTSRCGLM